MVGYVFAVLEKYTDMAVMFFFSFAHISSRVKSLPDDLHLASPDLVHDQNNDSKHTILEHSLAKLKVPCPEAETQKQITAKLIICSDVKILNDGHF